MVKSSIQRASVVIPAHNESQVIGRCLRELLASAEDGEFEVVVVANACLDNTAEVASSFGPAVHVVVTDTPGKANALNLGDRAAATFPRVYVDADIVMTTSALRKLVAEVSTERACAAAPRMEVDLAKSTWPVRAFYRIWRRHPYFLRGMIGSGVYAMSGAGRARFLSFPLITADDAFARLQFSEGERDIVSDASFTISAPRTLRSLVAIKTRSRRGNMELREVRPDLFRDRPKDARFALVTESLRTPSLLPSFPVYAWVAIATWVRAKRAALRGDHARWERDETSRSI